MKVKQIVLFSVFFAIGVLLCGYISYQKGVENGYARGWQEGEKIGYEKGYLEADEKGYERGYLIGKEEGVAIGYTNGEIVGYEDGYEEAYKLVDEIRNQKYTNQEAYKLGWSFWFSSYGRYGEGVKYLPYYTYGRSYKKIFETQEDAFSVGYKDAFYYVNKEEPDEYWLPQIEKGIKEYLG